MGIQFRIGAIALGLVAASAAFANIYSNRSTDTRVPALNPRPISDSGVAAPVGGFWSEVENDFGNTTESNTTAGASCRSLQTATGEFRLADDFSVVNGKMVITAVKGYAYRSGAASSTSVFDSGNANILSAAPNASPTTLGSGNTFSQSYAVPVSASGATITTGNVFRCFNTTTPAPGTAPGVTRHLQECRIGFATPVTVGTGTYWVDYQMNHPLPSSVPVGFAPNTTHDEARFPLNPVGIPGNALQLTATGWVASIDLGVPATAPDIPQDFPFILEGHVIRFTEHFTVIEGTLFGGVNANLQESDDSSVYVLLDENTPNSNIQFLLKTSLPFSSTFNFIVESGSDRDDQNFFVEISSSGPSGWDAIGIGVTSLTDVTNSYVVNGAQNYVVPTLDWVIIRIRTIPQNDLETADGWANRYDQVNLRCNP